MSSLTYSISNDRNPLVVASLSSHGGLAASTPKPLLRPTPQAPRSTLLSPIRSTAPSIASSHTARPYSPPPLRPSSATKRYPSPPSIRPRSVLGRAGSPSPANGALHAQQSLSAMGPTKEELESFANLCRALYFEQDPTAAQAVDQTLQRLPAASRTAYARTMAAVRTQFHRLEEIRRRTSVEAALSTCTPGGLVMATLRISEGGTNSMRSSRAKAVRLEKLRAFLKAHCLKGLPGSLPFIRALFAVLWLQGLAEKKGGAGKRRVAWTVDVNVFTEAGGGSWMQDSVEILKSVLGFTERIKETSQTPSYFEDEDGDTTIPPGFSPAENLLSEEEQDELNMSASPSPLPTSKSSRRPPKVPPHRPVALVRTRAISDPFVDPNERKPPIGGPLTPPLSSPSSGIDDSSTLLLPNYPATFSRSSTPPSRSVTTDPSSTSESSTPPSPSLLPDALPSPEPQFRIFTAPAYLTNPELHELCALFPEFVTSRETKFGSGGRRTKVEDVESGTGEETLCVGHGEISLALPSFLRDAGWKGTKWERFLGWLKGVFGR